MPAPMRGRGGRRRYQPLAEINVTPLVDVMLVLLIIFMVAAPLMTSGVNVDLPKASANPLSQDSEPLTVTVNAEGKIYLQETETPLPDLATKLSGIADGKMDRRIFVRGDKALSYGRIMEVMATITQGGFTKVALLAEQAGAPSGAGVRTPAAPNAAPRDCRTCASAPARVASQAASPG